MNKKLWLFLIVLVNGIVDGFGGRPDPFKKYIFYRPSMLGLPMRVPCIRNGGRLILKEKELYGVYDQDDQTVCINRWDDLSNEDLYIRAEPLRDTLAKMMLFTTGVTAATVASVALINKIYEKKICIKRAMRLACGGSLAAFVAYYAMFGPYIMF